MILDVLPYKHPNGSRQKLGFIRYITFALSLALVVGLFLAKSANLERIMLWVYERMSRKGFAVNSCSVFPPLRS